VIDTDIVRWRNEPVLTDSGPQLSFTPEMNTRAKLTSLARAFHFISAQPGEDAKKSFPGLSVLGFLNRLRDEFALRLESRGMKNILSQMV